MLAIAAAAWLGWVSLRQARRARRHHATGARLAGLRNHIDDANARHALRIEHELQAAFHAAMARRTAHQADAHLRALTEAGYPGVSKTIRRWRDA